MNHQALNLKNGEYQFNDQPQLAHANPLFVLDALLSQARHGMLILDETSQLVYINTYAHTVLVAINQNWEFDKTVPAEIQHVYQFLRSSREYFPDQLWFVDSKIVIDSSITVNLRARWLTIETVANPYLLMTLENENHFIQQIAFEEIQRYGLSVREGEVWILHRTGCTYKDIAKKLDITPNTVKKHMKSIFAKQRNLNT
jgi:DNA-binding CsgD family transcriptional regulator